MNEDSITYLATVQAEEIFVEFGPAPETTEAQQ